MTKSKKLPEMKIAFALYDGKYQTDKDNSICYEIVDTIEEAREDRTDFGDDTVIVKMHGIQVKIGLIEVIHSEIVA
jgi:hypothetical protein